MNPSPLTFEERKDRIACLLGVIEVAAIFPLDKISIQGMRAYWSLYLCGSDHRYFLATDTDSAKAAVQDQATAWLRAAAVRPLTADELDEDRMKALA